MADEITVTISGLDKLQANLEALDDKLARKAAREAVRAGGVVVQEAMVQAAPKETGIMAKHIDVKTRGVRGEARSVSAFIGPNSREIIHEQTGGATAGLHRTAAFLAKLLEWGGVKMPKNPFLTAAWESSKGRALDAIITKLRHALE
jgi:HK97 gp10 family phage protein